jgi:hypothetical protein
MGKSNKKKVFSSPAISIIHKIVSKNTKFKNDNIMSKINKSNFIKKNKSLVKLIKGTGSLIAAAANQKSYSNSYGSNTNVKNKDSWIDNNVKWLWKKGVSAKDATFSGIGNNVKWLWKKGVSAKDATFSGIDNNVKWLWKKGVSAKDATFSGIGNNVKWLWKKGVSAKDATFSGIDNNVKWLWKKGVSAKDATFSWLGNKSVGIKDWYENSKEEIKKFFEVSDWINKGKEGGQKILETFKNFGYGLSYKMQDMWDHPWTKRVRKVGNGAFKFLDIVGNINKVVHASTPEEKMIEVSKIIGAKVGSIALGTGLGALGGIIPGAQPAIPIFAGTGAYFGDKWGEKLGGWGGKALTNIWPKSWWPLKKVNTSSIKPTKNIGLDKSRAHNILSSSTKKTKQIHVNLPNGAIQISNNNHKLDYSDLANQISNQFVKELRRAMENRKTIMA